MSMYLPLRSIKRQCYISDYFLPGPTTSLEQRRPQSSSFPELPPSIQSSLLTVGMRVRKAVSDSQDFEGFFGHFEAGVPYCKEELVPNHGLQIRMRDKGSRDTTFTAGDIANGVPSSSQESACSSFSEPAVRQYDPKRKRPVSDESEQDPVDNVQFFANAMSEDSLWSFQPRHKLVPRSRSARVWHRPVKLIIDQDFEDATFLRPPTPDPQDQPMKED